MKKVKFLLLGILSILLISPVVADDVNIGENRNTLTSFISFESLNNSYNITYGFTPVNDYRSSWYTNSYYLDSNLNKQYNIGYYNSTSIQSGSYFDNSYNPFTIISGSYSLGNISSNYFGYLGIGFYNNKLLPTFLSVYFQGVNSGYTNKVLQFSSRSDFTHYTFARKSYIRALFDYSSDSGLWFFSNNYPTSIAIPTSLQLFDGSQYFYTEKGRALVNGKQLDKVSPSVGNGFSFVAGLQNAGNTFMWEDINFYSVLPNWDSSWSSSSSAYTLPSSTYIPGIYIFKMNSAGRNSQYDEIGVITKCNNALCGSIGTLENYLSDLVISNYICDFSQSYDLKNNCILVGGGIINHGLGSITGLNNTYNVSQLPTFIRYISFNFGSNNLQQGNPFASFNLNTSPYRLSYTYYNNYYHTNSYKSDLFTDSLNIIYTGGYSISNPPDILGDTSIPDITPPDSGGGSNSSGNIDLNSGSAVDVLDILCNSSVIKPVWCNRINEVAPGVDGFWWLDLSGNLVYSLVGYDQDNGGYWYDLQPDGSGGYQFVCDLETDYFCPLTGSIGSFEVVNSANPQGFGFSGFILSQDYYDNFFTKTGYFAKCPYPYTDFNIGLHNKVLNKFYDTLGFDIFLPVNCGVAAFTAGKTFRFLSDVSLGLSPLMGEIHSPSDPRVYLYRFLDFLLSFALFMFLLKLYHLLN